MVVKRISKGRHAGLYKATIGFKNNYAKKGTSELFETKYDAEGWLKAVKKVRKR